VAVSAASVADLQRVATKRQRITMSVGVAAAIILGLLAGAVGSKMFVALAVGLAIALPFIWWRNPTFGVLSLLGCAVVIEQFGYVIPGRPGLDAFTDRIPVFASLQGAYGLQGLVFSPIDIAIVVLLLVWLTRGVTERSLRLPRSQVAATMGVMLLLVGVALLRGSGLGGTDTRAALWEARPWVYLGASYLFASQFITTRRAFHAVLWAFVLGSGFKAIQGVYIFFQTRGLNPAPDAILAHEESFFFGLFAILTFGLWIFGWRGRLRTTATALLPLVLLADFGNARRDAFLVLAAGLVVLVVLAYVAIPDRRPVIRRVLAGALLVSVVYFPLEWSGSGTLAEPARAVRSAVAPDARDQLSNQYRLEEDANLGVMIQNANPLLGTGFGIPIDYGSVPIVNITNVDSFIDWVPHNGVLYVWMRMGIPGELALWLLVAAAIMAGTRATRSEDREVALLGALVASATVGWLVMGYTDMGFYWFRMAVAFGVLLGLLHAMTTRELTPVER
jgi:hypothetical protein